MHYYLNRRLFIIINILFALLSLAFIYFLQLDFDSLMQGISTRILVWERWIGEVNNIAGLGYQTVLDLQNSADSNLEKAIDNIFLDAFLKYGLGYVILLISVYIALIILSSIDIINRGNSAIFSIFIISMLVVSLFNLYLMSPIVLLMFFYSIVKTEWHERIRVARYRI